jgi:hypothetical protein
MMKSIDKPTLTYHTNEITPKLLSGFIDDCTNKEFLRIFDHYCSESKPVTNRQFNFDAKNKINIEFECVLREAFYLLSSNGFRVDMNDGLIELWKYTSNGTKVCVPLGIHCDDYGALNYAVETCIFYLDKNDCIDGGGLYYMENTKENKLLGLFSYYDTEKKYLDVSSNMVVLLAGNLEHRPKSIIGLGSRKCIVVQFRSLDRN